MLATWRIGPALAAGDTVVAKPPEWAPLTASLLADITAEAGMPPGVFNVVQEKFVRGGVQYNTNNGRKAGLKGLSNIIAVNQINTKLWELAEQYC
jgi:acyl-CoA reductase-like NAD-dependent aldehyde dehydrogenase